MNAICAVATRYLIGVTAIVIAGRVAERDRSQTHTDAHNRDDASSLAKSLSFATGSAVRVTYRDVDGEHSFNARPEHIPVDGSGAMVQMPPVRY